MDDLKNRILEKIKIARGKRYLTNCYTVDVVNCSQNLWSDNDEFVFSYVDHGVERLVFFAENWDNVDAMLKMVDSGTYYLEFMTKNPKEYKPEGSNLTAQMMRLANSDCRAVFDSPVIQYQNSTIIEDARESDAKEINKILWSTFHTEISHLLTDDELRNKIDQFTVHKNDDGHIDALLQAEVMPKKFYINQIVNKTDKNVVHALLLDRLKNYVDAGGKYLFAWVDSTNIASLKFHGKYGMEHDGMYSMVYCIEG